MQEVMLGGLLYLHQIDGRLQKMFAGRFIKGFLKNLQSYKFQANWSMDKKDNGYTTALNF